ncbi:hypothetical protein Pint_03392 [Pistacia integerrima]|uniref:Uncharacterized protein n=1 Tax=Pistacia integerrima TaxID=434235 RepID=A0ACC0ZMM9_9ROSI|nr:hypothetical protein Pint_03392 [Pistacia integerrima]
MDVVVVSEELARELLMGISCSLPQKLLNFDNVPENFDRADAIPARNGDGDEKYSGTRTIGRCKPEFLSIALMPYPSLLTSIKYQLNSGSSSSGKAAVV